jgi:hypothetical protein
MPSAWPGPDTCQVSARMVSLSPNSRESSSIATSSAGDFRLRLRLSHRPPRGRGHGSKRRTHGPWRWGHDGLGLRVVAVMATSSRAELRREHHPCDAWNCHRGECARFLNVEF